MDDLAVQVENNQLVVRGRQTDEKDRVYLYRGIAARQFQRSFVLAEGIEVSGAALDNGLLHIDLKRPMPAPQVRRSEEHTSELQSLMRNSYAVFCLKKKNRKQITKEKTNQQ